MSENEIQKPATAESVAVPADAGQEKSTFRLVLMTVSISVLVSLLAMAPVAYKLYKAMPAAVATVDLQQLVEEDQKKTMSILDPKGNITEDQRQSTQKLTMAFAKSLSGTVDQIGVECGCVIVNKAALLAGTAVDYTDEVRARMKR